MHLTQTGVPLFDVALESGASSCNLRDGNYGLIACSRCGLTVPLNAPARGRAVRQSTLLCKRPDGKLR